jgi:5,10-methylenetetrahydromethanopterin reductase
MGKPQLTRRYFETYMRQLIGLLRGETVEVDGAMARMLHPEGYGPPRPIDVPILVGGNGPRGQAFAREIGAAGIVTSGQTVVSGFDWVSPLAFGTVLEEGESPTSPRALAATRGGMVGRYHGAWERNREALPELPRGREWLAAIERFPERERHLAVHEGHLVAPSPTDASVLDFAELPPQPLTGTPAEIRERIDELGRRGATEVMWQPMGPDIPREMRAFATALEL